MYLLFVSILTCVLGKQSMDVLDETCGNIMREMKYIEKGYCITNFSISDTKTETFCIETIDFMNIIGIITIHYIFLWCIYKIIKIIYNSCLN
jgi:hypothetical protein